MQNPSSNIFDEKVSLIYEYDKDSPLFIRMAYIEIEKNNVHIEEAVQAMIPQNTIKLDGKQAEQMFKLMEMLDDHDDIQDVNANFDIDDEVLAQLAGE